MSVSCLPACCSGLNANDIFGDLLAANILEAARLPRREPTLSEGTALCPLPKATARSVNIGAVVVARRVALNPETPELPLEAEPSGGLLFYRQAKWSPHRKAQTHGLDTQ